MGAKFFIRTPWMRNEVILKNILVWGYVKMYSFHGNPLYDSQ